MKQTLFLLFALAFLVFGAGCTDPAETSMPENVTPTRAMSSITTTTSGW